MIYFSFSSCRPCRFGCDTLISGFQWRVFAENWEDLSKAKKGNSYKLKLEKVEGNILHVRSIDTLNKTPVLDIKPWLPCIDCPGGKINLDIEEKLELKKKK